MYQTRELPVPLMGHFYFLFTLPCKKTVNINVCASFTNNPRAVTCIQVLEEIEKKLCDSWQNPKHIKTQTIVLTSFKFV